MRGTSEGPTGRRSGGGTRGEGARRASPVGLLALLVIALVAFSGCGGQDEDPREAVARAVTAMRDAVGTDPKKVDGAALCDRVDPRTLSAVQRLGGEITGTTPVGRCADVLVAARWRVRPFAAFAAAQPIDVARVTVDGDVATVRPEGSGAPLRLRRVDGEWRADLLADPRWRYRLERVRACTAAGRRFSRQRLPTGGPASARAYLRQQVAILRRFERDVAEHRAPAALRGRDAGLRRTLRRARRRAESTLRRAAGDEIAAAEAIATTATPDWDPAAQLPGAVSRRIYPITEGCLNASVPAADPPAAKRIQRRCSVVVRRLTDMQDVTTPDGYERELDRVTSAYDGLARAVGQATAPAPIVDVQRQTSRGIRRVARGMRAFVGLVRAGDLAGIEATTRRLAVTATGLDRGLAQLGVPCVIPDELPVAPSTPA